MNNPGKIPKIMQAGDIAGFSQAENSTATLKGYAQGSENTNFQRGRGMYLNVSEILKQKINEIQNRLPIRMNIPGGNKSFEEVLDRTMEKATSKWNKEELFQIIEEKIQSVSRKYNINPNLLKAVIKQESDFNPFALSEKGAMGLMQIMPSTAKSLGLTDVWDIDQNIDGGARYLKQQLDKFTDIKHAIAAYNAGPGAVINYSGIPPYAETRDFVEKVMQYFMEYENTR